MELKLSFLSAKVPLPAMSICLFVCASLMFHSVFCGSRRVVGGGGVFNLITAHAPISALSSNLVVFRIQSVFFYLLLYKKKHKTG